MITKLSPETISRFPDYVEKWTKVGYDTTPLDHDAVRAAIAKMYTCGGLTPPEKVVFCTGPINAILVINMYMFLQENPKATKAQVIEYAKTKSVSTLCGYGQHSVDWMAFYDVFMNETDIKGLEIVEGLMDVAKTCGWYWSYKDICFVAEKPLVCKVNDVNQLHCVDGPAVAYTDGTKVFSYDGVIMDEKTIMDPKSITVDEINNTVSEEQKRIKIEIYGTSNYLQDIKANLVDMDMIKINPYDPDSVSIPRALIKDKDGNMFFVGTDGSTQRTYYMNVPKTVTTCVEAHNAIAPLPESDCVAAS